MPRSDDNPERLSASMFQQFDCIISKYEQFLSTPRSICTGPIHRAFSAGQPELKMLFDLLSHDIVRSDGSSRCVQGLLQLLAAHAMTLNAMLIQHDADLSYSPLITDFVRYVVEPRLCKQPSDVRIRRHLPTLEQAITEMNVRRAAKSLRRLYGYGIGVTEGVRQTIAFGLMVLVRIVTRGMS